MSGRMLNPSIFRRDCCLAARVQIDGVKGIFKAYVERDSWNGFAMPYFTKEEGMRIARAISVPGGPKLSYWASKDAFVETCDGERTTYKAMQIPTMNGLRKLYPIGNSVWMWDIVGYGW